MYNKVTMKEENNKFNSSKQEELENKINLATQTLDRNIGFVTNCDNKASIVLTALGVLFTIILTSDGIKKIFHIIKNCIKAHNFLSIMFLVLFAITIIVMAYGIICLCRVLIAKTNCSKRDADNPSRIFFSGIIKFDNSKAYNNAFRKTSQEDFLNDLIEQIYINSDIATSKYTHYNCGLKYTIIGFIFFVILLSIGICFY